jgi:outer membrane protein TolC
VQLRQDELAVVQNERDVASAKATLAALLGEPGLVIEVRPLDVLPAPAPTQAAVPAVEAARAAAVASAAEARQGRFAFVPRLTGWGAAGALSRFQEGWLPTTAVGVDLSWTAVGPAALADLGRLDAVRRASQARADAAEATADAAIATADAELAAAAAGLELARESLALAEAELAQAEAQYQAGAADNLAVVQAQNRRGTLARGLVDATAAWDRAVIRWYASRGTLGPLGG